MQIALLVTPFLVILGWIIGQDMTLHFETFETVVFFLSVLVVNCTHTSSLFTPGPEADHFRRSHSRRQIKLSRGSYAHWNVSLCCQALSPYLTKAHIATVIILLPLPSTSIPTALDHRDLK